jgi:hypothetical protein
MLNEYKYIVNEVAAERRRIIRLRDAAGCGDTCKNNCRGNDYASNCDTFNAINESKRRIDDLLGYES